MKIPVAEINFPSQIADVREMLVYFLSPRFIHYSAGRQVLAEGVSVQETHLAF